MAQLAKENAPVAVAIVAMALFGSVLAYLWWNQGIARIGTTRTAIFINLVPVFTVLIGGSWLLRPWLRSHAVAEKHELLCNRSASLKHYDLSCLWRACRTPVLKSAPTSSSHEGRGQAVHGDHLRTWISHSMAISVGWRAVAC